MSKRLPKYERAARVCDEIARKVVEEAEAFHTLSDAMDEALTKAVVLQEAADRIRRLRK